MKNISTILTVVFSVVLFVSCASKKEREDFLKEAARAGAAEVRLSELAIQNAAHAGVREFAGQMVTDHGEINEEIARLSAKKRVNLPEEISEDQDAAINNLSERSGMDFDKAYMDQVIQDHETAVALYRTQADEGSDKDVKAFAARTLPALEGHLAMARDLRARLDQPGAYDIRPLGPDGDTVSPGSGAPASHAPDVEPVITPGTGQPGAHGSGG